MMYVVQCICLPLLVLSTSCVFAQQCGNENPITAYVATLPSRYNGFVSIGPDMGECSLSGADLFCIPPIVLGDDAPDGAADLSSSEYLNNFVAWNSSISRPYVVFQVLQASQVNAVDLYFLHYPAEGIALPNLELFRVDNLADTSSGTLIPYTLINNQDLESGDSQVRRVTLRFNSITQRSFRLDMSFSDLHNTDWFFLSQIRLCMSSQTRPSGTFDFQTPQAPSAMVDATPEDLTAGFVELTCVVSSQGSFEWQWIKEGAASPLDNGGKYTITTASGSRMSVLTISELDVVDSGTYQCQVNRVGDTATVQTRSFVLTVPDEVPTATIADSTATESTSTAQTTTGATDIDADEKCDSCGTTIALTAVLTLLSAGGISVLTQVIVCIKLKKLKAAARCQCTSTTQTNSERDTTTQATTPQGEEERVYDVIDDKVKGSAMEMERNKAYATFQ